MDFSRADAVLIASNGRATSMSFFFVGHALVHFSFIIGSLRPR